MSSRNYVGEVVPHEVPPTQWRNSSAGTICFTITASGMELRIAVVSLHDARLLLRSFSLVDLMQAEGGVGACPAIFYLTSLLAATGTVRITFLTRRCRSNDAPSVLPKDSCIFALPPHGRPGFASHADAYALPKRSQRISPDNDPRLQYLGRLPTDTRRRDDASDHIHASHPKIPWFASA